jgi:hypothetical protein
VVIEAEPTEAAGAKAKAKTAKGKGKAKGISKAAELTVGS